MELLTPNTNETVKTNTKLIIQVNTATEVECLTIDKNELNIKHPVIDNIRTGKALKLDKNHAFPDVVDNFAQQAEKFTIKGGDNIVRELYQIEGSLGTQDGIFEWIVDPRPDYGVTHRFFIKNGKITGKPNIW